MQWNMDHSRHNIEDVAAGYDALPKYDPKAVHAWKQLADESKEHADYIRQHLNVTETDNPEPYDNSEDMIRDIRNNRNFIVSTANSEHPIWTPEQNVDFRIVHDVFGHAATEGDFDWHGENNACSTHFALSSPHSQKALATECLGQTGYAIHRGNFTDQKVGFIPGLHEGLAAANKDTPIPTQAQLMQRALYGPLKQSKWKTAANAATEQRIQRIADQARSKGLDVQQSNNDGYLETQIHIGQDEYYDSRYVIYISHGNNRTQSIFYDRPESKDYRTNLSAIEQEINSIDLKNFDEMSFGRQTDMFDEKKILWNRYSKRKTAESQDANKMYRQHTDGTPVAETTFESIQNKDTSEPYEDEYIIINGKKWKKIRRKNNPQPDTYKDPIGGWGFYSKLIDEIEKQPWVIVSNEIAKPIDVNNIDQYPIPTSYKIVEKMIPHFARYGVIPIARKENNAAQGYPLNKLPEGGGYESKVDYTYDHNIHLYDPETQQIVYGMEYSLNHPDAFEFHSTDGMGSPIYDNPDDEYDEFYQHNYPTYVNSIHYNAPARHQGADDPRFYDGGRIYLSELNEEGKPSNAFGDYNQIVDKFNKRYPRLSLSVLRWMHGNLPKPIGADIVNPKLKEKARKQDYYHEAKWKKVSIPPAEEAKEYAKGYEKSEEPSSEYLEERYKWNPEVRGHRWKLNYSNLERVFNHPDFPVKGKYNVFTVDPKSAPTEDTSMKHWKRTPLGTHEAASPNRAGSIHINPLISAESANEALWHELQHAYQDQEGRFTPEMRENYFDPTDISGLSDEEVDRKFKENYLEHPMEKDANKFADFMRQYPLIEQSEPVYKSRWVNFSLANKEVDEETKSIINKYYEEHGSQRRLPLPSIESKWKKISVGLWDPERTEPSRYYGTKVVEEIPLNIAMQMLDIERGKEDYERENIENLVENVSQNGLLEPVIIEFNINDNTAYIGEGNHRVQVAKKMGMEWIPARCVRNEYRKSRFKELPVRWQGTQTDAHGNLYIPPHFPPHMIGLPVKEKVKGFEDDHFYNGWDTKESKWKIAGKTKTRLLQDAKDLDENYTDTSDIVHTFDDGWTIRKLNTIGDAHREGTLMSNCMTPEGEWPPPYCDVAARMDPNFSIERHRDFPWEDHFDKEIRKDDKAIYSLRNPENLPHATYDSGGATGFDSPILGRHNDLPKPEYRKYWDEWFATNKKQPFNWNQWDRQSSVIKEAPARSKAQYRYMQGICNGSIEPPEGMTRTQACEYVEGQSSKGLPEKKSHWVKGYHAAVLDPNSSKIYIANSPAGFHTTALADNGYEEGWPEDAWRGLYNPETKELVHMSSPDEAKNPAFWEILHKDGMMHHSPRDYRKTWLRAAENQSLPVSSLRVMTHEGDNAYDLPNTPDSPGPESDYKFYTVYDEDKGPQAQNAFLSKIAKQQEMEKTLTKMGFSEKAAVLMALDYISKQSYWINGYHAAVALRDPETKIWHMDVGFNDKLTHGGVTADYINDLGTKTMREMVADKDSRTDYYNNHTARGLYHPITKDFIHMSHPDFWDETEYNFKDLNQDSRNKMEEFWRQLAEQNNIELGEVRVLNNQTGHVEDLSVSDLEMPEEVERARRMYERNRPLNPWERERGGYDTKTGKTKTSHWIKGYNAAIINQDGKMEIAESDPDRIYYDDDDDDDPTEEWHLTHWDIGGMPRYRGLYNPKTRDLIHMTSPEEYHRITDGEGEWYDFAENNRPEYPFEEEAINPEGHKDVWANAAREAGIPVDSVRLMYADRNQTRKNYNNQNDETDFNIKTAHWIQGFHAAIINQHGKMEVAPPTMKIVDNEGNVTEKDDTPWYASHWDLQGYPQYRGLYNHQTGELIHMTSLEEYENLINEEYLDKSKALNPLEHETSWRKAAEESNIPINNFKLMYKRGEDESEDEPLKKIWSNPLNTKEDFDLTDPEEFMPKQSKWRKGGHWLKDYHAAIITPKGEMKIARGWDEFHGSLFIDTGRNYHRGLYNKKTGQLLHMTTPEEWNKLKDSWGGHDEDYDKRWPMGFEWFNSPEHFISPYKTEKEWIKAAEENRVPISEVKFFSGESEFSPLTGFDVNNFNTHSPQEVAAKYGKWKVSKKDAWETVLDGKLGHDIITTGTWEEVKKQTIKWLKQLKDGYINKKNPHDNDKIDPDAKEQDGHALEDLKLYEEQKRWSFRFDHGKHPYDLIIQPVGYKESKWKRKSHWIKDFHAAVIDPEGTMHIAQDWNDVHDQVLRQNGWPGGTLPNSYRGLYNPETKELFHMTSPDERGFTIGEYATEPSQFKDLNDHENVWRQAAKQSGISVEDFKGLYKPYDSDENSWRTNLPWSQENPKETFRYVSPKQSKWKKRSHWIDGYHAAVITKDGNMLVAENPHFAHVQAFPEEEVHSALINRNYWRGLYNPDTESVLHMSTPDEYKKMQAGMVELAPLHGGILTEQHDYYDNNWKAAAKKSNIPISDVKLVSWNTSEPYPAWDNSRYKNDAKQFHIADLKTSKWKTSDKKKRKIHPKFQTSLKDHQKSVRKHGPLKTHKVRNFKKKSVLNEDQGKALFEYEPYMYHDVAAARTKGELKDQIDTVKSILNNGILPKEQTGISEYDDWLTSRPNHVYIGREGFYPRTVPPAIRINMSKIDPSTLKPDEDIYHAFGFSDKHKDQIDIHGLKSAPFEEEHRNNPNYTLGQWMEDHSHLDTPKNVLASFALNNSLAVHGGVPADALEISPKWVDHIKERHGIDITKML